MDTSNWRFQLQAASRQRMVNRIMVTLKRHLPHSGQEGLEELNKIAVRFEEKNYNAASSPVDYLQRISLKLQSMETRIPMPAAAQAQGFQVMQQVNIQRQPLPIHVPSYHLQQHNMYNNIVSTGDWRAQLQPDSRQRIVNKIMDTLKRHLPDEGLHELKKMADRFENEIYTAATSQPDYLRKISLKMLTMESQSQKSHFVANSGNPSSSGSQVMQQVKIQGSPHPICVPSHHPQHQQGQQLLSSQTMHNNIFSTINDSFMEVGDWRDQLQEDSRKRIVNKIMDTLKRHLQFSRDEGQHELEKMADRFEDEIYTAATSQSDYLRKISLKMLSMETRSSQNSVMP